MPDATGVVTGALRRRCGAVRGSSQGLRLEWLASKVQEMPGDIIDADEKGVSDGQVA